MENRRDMNLPNTVSNRPYERGSQIERGISIDEMEVARNEYLRYLEYECVFKMEGLPVPQDVLLKTIALEEMFVPLRFAIIPKHWKEVRYDFDDGYINAHKDWFGLTCPVSDENDKYNCHFRAVVFSGPGGGKTTFMRRLVSAYGIGNIDKVNDSLPKRSLFPIWIKCRDFNDIGEAAILDIVRRIPINAEFGGDQRITEAFYLLVMKHIDDGDAMFLFDGLDEIKDVTSRQAFINKVKSFTDRYKNVNIILSSRLIGFEQITNSLFSDFHRWLILPFNEKEVERLCVSWHQILFDGEKDIITSAKKLSDTITKNDRIFRLAKMPILLTTLLLLNKQLGGRLPIRRTELYLEAMKVLLYTWGVAIHKPIDPRTALPHLAYLAWQMMFDDDPQPTIGETKLVDILLNARKDLEEYALYSLFKDVRHFVDEVEERSSILIKRGYRNKVGTTLLERDYEFQHLTFQEFLAAYAIVNKHYPNAKDNTLVGDCFNGRWEDPALKEVILLTSVLTDKWGAQGMAQKILDLLEEIKGHRNTNRESKIIYLRNLLLQMIADEALFGSNYREKIYTACFSSRVYSNMFRSEFFAIYTAEESTYDSDEHGKKMVQILTELDDTRKYPLFGPLFKLIKLREEPSFSIYSYYNEKKETDSLFEALRFLDIALWLGWDWLGTNTEKQELKKTYITQGLKEDLKKDLINYLKGDDMNIAVIAYRVLYGLDSKNDHTFDGNLLQLLSRFASNPEITVLMDRFPISQDTLIFLQGYSLIETQKIALNENMKNEMNSTHLLNQFWFGIFYGVWDIVTVIQKAEKFHSATYLAKKEKCNLFTKMQQYLSILKNSGFWTSEIELMAEKYQNDVGKDFNVPKPTDIPVSEKNKSIPNRSDNLTFNDKDTNFAKFDKFLERNGI